MKNTLLKLLICAAICSAAAFAGCSTNGAGATNEDGSGQNAVTRSVTGDISDGEDDGETPDEDTPDEKPSETPDERPSDKPDFPPPPKPRGEFPHGGARRMPLPHRGHGERHDPPEKEQTPSEETSRISDAY